MSIINILGEDSLLIPGPPPSESLILLEDATHLLLETNDKLIRDE